MDRSGTAHSPIEVPIEDSKDVADGAVALVGDVPWRLRETPPTGPNSVLRFRRALDRGSHVRGARHNNQPALGDAVPSTASTTVGVGKGDALSDVIRREIVAGRPVDVVEPRSVLWRDIAPRDRDA